MSKKRKTQKFFRKHGIKIGTIFIILLTIASAFAVVAGNMETEPPAPSAEYVGSWGGQEFFKKDYKDYFTIIGGEDWHFRGDPMLAKDINVTPEENDVLRALQGVSEAVLIIDPKADERVLVASTDMARLMAIMRIPVRYAFSEKSDAHPEVPKMSSWDANSQRATIEFRAPENNTRISVQWPLRPNAIIVEAKDYDTLDAAVARLSLIVFGVSE